MLEIELDVFSGMPNSTWILSRSQEARLYELLRSEPDQISVTIGIDSSGKLPLKVFTSIESNDER
jgi:hypothetical protein